MVNIKAAIQKNFPKPKSDPEKDQRQNASILAKDIMTTKLVFVSPQTSVFDLVQTMDEKKISAVPVMDDEELVGIVTDGDLLQREELGASPSSSGKPQIGSNLDFNKSHGAFVRDVMSRVVTTITENTKLEQICEMMRNAGLKHLPVLTKGEVVGIVSRSDIVHALAGRPEGAGSPKTSDDDIIRYRVFDTLVGMAGTSPWSTSVDVVAGVVSLQGMVEDEDVLLPSAEAIGKLEHVKDVDDHRAILQPY